MSKEKADEEINTMKELLFFLEDISKKTSPEQKRLF